MYFKKLELVGFKSFCNKTTLQFEPGVTAIVGPNGCGKCLSYDSLVTLSDGSLVKIGELVERALKESGLPEKLDDGLMTLDNRHDIRVLSLNPHTLNIEPRLVYAFIKRKAPEYLLEIKTKSGKRIITTHYHPFFSIKDGQVIDLKAEQLKVGIRIAAPRVIRQVAGSPDLDLLEIFKKFRSEDNVYIPYSEELSDFLTQAMGGSISESEKVAVKSALSGQAINVANFNALLEKAGIKEVPDFVKRLKSRSCGEIKLARGMNTAIARTLGYLISEGRSTKENQVWFVNEDKKIITDFMVNAYKAFEVEAKAFNYKPCAQDVLIFSSVLCEFLEKAFNFRVSAPSKDKAVPPQIFKADENIIREFLSTLFEGDGYICTNKQKNKKAVYFEYATASKELACGVRSLLLRLGVQSVIREKLKAATNAKHKNKKTYYSVYVYGLENALRLADLLRFVGKKSAKLEELKKLHSKSNPNLDLIPEINVVFKKLVQLAGIKVKRFKKTCPKLVSYYENQCLPSRQGLLEALSIVAEHGRISGLARALYDYLKSLAGSDIYWDEVVDIKKVYSKEWVYDLSVPETHNFVAEDIIVHNSNIFDSIRWVLGEQSVKSLRGSEMQDVIFNGTDKKEPLSMAEVSVTFDNKARFFAVEHDEIVITRRLFRSGESEYLLNKTQVRLKDIMDLLLGTGIGAESYSLVPQGKIDMILSSRPEDRRMVFDEAAGITKYKSQKREATRKLEETEQNLLRVNDIITEVKRQIGSLERQANKARRYKELFEELKAREINLATLQKKTLHKQNEDISLQLNNLQAEEDALVANIEKQEAKIADQRQQAQALQESITNIRNEVLNLENTITRNKERIGLSHERIAELEEVKKHLDEQVGQTQSRLKLDEEKLNSVKDEYNGIEKNIEEKTALLKEKEEELNNLNSAIKLSLDNITRAKRGILELAAGLAHAKNEVADFTAKEQIHLARQKRLEIENAKVREEKSQAEANLNDIAEELADLDKDFSELGSKASAAKEELGQENISLSQINVSLADLDKRRLALDSQRQFLDELKTKYEDIGESMNALLYLDKMPGEKSSGLLIRIKEYLDLDKGEKAIADFARVKISGEAKPMDLDTQKISEHIVQIESKITALKGNKTRSEARIAGLNNNIQALQEELRRQEMVLVNKRAQHKTAQDEAGKISEEENIIALELSDVEGSLSQLRAELNSAKSNLGRLENELKNSEDLISEEQNKINSNNRLKEGAIVAITQTKAEVEALGKRIISDQATIAILDDTYRQDKEALRNQQEQKEGASAKQLSLEAEIKDLEEGIGKATEDIEKQKSGLKDVEAGYVAVLDGTSGIVQKIELDKKEVDNIKNKRYQLQVQAKDVEFKYLGMKERILQGYKVDLDTLEEVPSGLDENTLAVEIRTMKEKLDSYGTVNLVAIEEYDELKKRYDFLTQQQNDLLTAKDSLHNAILKLNKTTKQMFLETFQKVSEEFRNYFRLLFNGGDARVFLINEEDPLESGIEIICRPPGKKLQNVLLLSGGEKSMSAIALVFAIFKVKPAPFCVLDEIDAALDEANVDRFGKLLQEFTRESQFIVITHNKKTIANTDVMYGITMEESGVSKIISVKFSERSPARDNKSQPVAEPV